MSDKTIFEMDRRELEKLQKVVYNLVEDYGGDYTLGRLESKISEFLGDTR